MTKLCALDGCPNHVQRNRKYCCKEHSPYGKLTDGTGALPPERFEQVKKLIKEERALYASLDGMEEMKKKRNSKRPEPEWMKKWREAGKYVARRQRKYIR